VTETRSTCCYCGTGCGVVVQTEGERIVGVRGDESHPSSAGKLCTKGSTLHLTMTPAALAGRARHPELRIARAGKRARVPWNEALDYTAARFAACIREHGPDSVAFYVSGQLLTEDYYAFNKLAKGLIGTANIDTNSRLCMSSAVTGYTKTLGADAPPCSYEDLDHAECLFIAGSNAAFAHPVLFRRIEAARDRNPALRIIVVDPRRTETARFADLHLAILPGTDVALFHGMLHVMLWERLVDEAYIAAHTEGFDALRDLVREYTPQAAAETCGIASDDLVAAARMFARSKATLSLYCQGLNQSASGTAKNASLINLHLATAQIGKPGAGPFSLTGQPNAMGGREVGGLATSLAGHRDLGNPAHRAEMERLWNVERVPSAPGLTAVELFGALAAGRVKMVWIACTNPMQSMPDLARVRAGLEAAQLVVLQDAYANTETAPFADVLLPATSWGEKDGTVTNSERRISRVRAALPRPFEARHDWEIACDFAKRLEGKLRPGAPSLFPFTSPEEIWNEHREVTRGRDLDITGLTYAILDERGPQHWPFPQGATEGKARLYEDGVFPTENGRARFFAEKHRAVADVVDARFPLRLTTGRLRDHWHGLSRTGNVTSLFGHVAEPRLGMNGADMARRGLEAGELVAVKSRRGTMHVMVEADASLRSGQAYLPMHWGKRFLGGRESDGVNTVTSPAFDPHSRQPELKHAAVKIERANLPWRLTAFVRVDPGRFVHVLDALLPLQSELAFASAVPFGRDAPGLLFRAAAEQPPSDAWVATLDRLLQLDGDDVLRYDDPRRGHSRRLRVHGEHLASARLTGDAGAIASGEWLREWLVSGQSVAEIRRALLLPSVHPPASLVAASRMVCQCLGVTERAVAASLAAASGTPAERLHQVQAALQCGTSCGSCLPELRALVADAGRSAQVQAA
jgi:assimilatory nitrate reductase catalytic subunit